jgi:hypothetical protein
MSKDKQEYNDVSAIRQKLQAGQEDAARRKQSGAVQTSGNISRASDDQIIWGTKQGVPESAQYDPCQPGQLSGIGYSGAASGGCASLPTPGECETESSSKQRTFSDMVRREIGRLQREAADLNHRSQDFACRADVISIKADRLYWLLDTLDSALATRTDELIGKIIDKMGEDQ